MNSFFKLNIADGNRSSTMRRQQKEARDLQATDVIIWDEISMAPKVALEDVDSLLKDIMQNELPFGGKVFVIGGDFRQVLPVVEHGQRQDIVDACVQKSALWTLFQVYRLETNMRVEDDERNWHQRLLEIGSGRRNDADSRIDIDPIMLYDGDIEAEIFGQDLNQNTALQFNECATLAPKNAHVERINDEILRRLIVLRPEDGRVYKSVDEAVNMITNSEQLFQLEYLNSLTPSGVPPHEL